MSEKTNLRQADTKVEVVWYCKRKHTGRVSKRW